MGACFGKKSSDATEPLPAESSSLRAPSGQVHGGYHAGPAPARKPAEKEPEAAKAKPVAVNKTPIDKRVATAEKTGVLALQNSALSKVPAKVYKLTNLRQIDLSDNKIGPSLSDELQALCQLKTLKLASNRLADLPHGIGALVKLEHLDVSGNLLQALPPQLALLKKLATLIVAQNRIGDLPAWIGKLTSLTLLDVSSNQLATIPPEMGLLELLSDLDLHGNQLSILPDQIGELGRLKRLSLASNRVESLPESLLVHTPLEKLEVEGNPIAETLQDLKGYKAYESRRVNAAGAKLDVTATIRTNELRYEGVG